MPRHIPPTVKLRHQFWQLTSTNPMRTEREWLTEWLTILISLRVPNSDTIHLNSPSNKAKNPLRDYQVEYPGKKTKATPRISVNRRTSNRLQPLPSFAAAKSGTQVWSNPTGLYNPATQPKRSPKPKKPLSAGPLANHHNIFWKCFKTNLPSPLWRPPHLKYEHGAWRRCFSGGNPQCGSSIRVPRRCLSSRGLGTSIAKPIARGW